MSLFPGPLFGSPIFPTYGVLGKDQTKQNVFPAMPASLWALIVWVVGLKTHRIRLNKSPDLAIARRLQSLISNLKNKKDRVKFIKPMTIFS